MSKERRFFDRKLGKGALVLSAAIMAGCEDPANPTPDPVAESVCRIVQSFDSDCDGVNNSNDKHILSNDWNHDTDFDGVADPIDFFSGDDFTDADGDGIANRFDIAPYNARTTVSDLLVMSGAADFVEVQRDNTAERAKDQGVYIDQQILANQILLDHLNRQSRDSDSDQIADIYDTQPFSHFSEDDDSDGWANGRDRWPLDDDNY